MKRLFLAVLLAAGAVAGFGSAFSDHDGPPCHRRDPVPAPEP